MNPKLILIGEVHGTKESALAMERILDEEIKLNNVTLCLEVDKSLEKEFIEGIKTESFLRFRRDKGSGIITPQLIKVLQRNVDNPKFNIKCVKSFEKQDYDLAILSNLKKIIKNSEDTIILLIGNYHIRNGSKIYNSLKNTANLRRIFLVPLSGKLYNMHKIRNYQIDKNFKFPGEVINIGKITPSFYE